MTKIEQAMNLLKANPGISNSDFIELLQKKLGMSVAGARTYTYNVRNGIGGKRKSKTVTTPTETKTKNAEQRISMMKAAQQKLGLTA